MLENGTAVGVKLKDGRAVKAGVVVHNAGMQRLIPAGRGEQPAQGLCDSPEAGSSGSGGSLDLGLNEPLLGTEHSLLHTMGWERTLNSYAPTFFDPKPAPPGKHMLDVFWVMLTLQPGARAGDRQGSAQASLPQF